MSPKKDTQESAKSTTAISKKLKGFTGEERAAMTAADEVRIGTLGML